MVSHYRWDFIGLSTDSKPTPATSEKVTDGSTFYCSDNSKLYVWYKNQWYEKTATGGGGEPYVLPIASSETLGGVKIGEGLSIDAQTGVLNAIGGGGDSYVKVLTPEDANWQNPNDADADTIALWLLPDGIYFYNPDDANMPNVAKDFYYDETSQSGYTNLVDTNKSYCIILTPFKETYGTNARSQIIIPNYQAANENIAINLSDNNGENFGYYDIVSTAGVDLNIATNYLKAQTSLPTQYDDAGYNSLWFYNDSSNSVTRVFCHAGYKTDPVTFETINVWDELGGGLTELTATPTGTTFGVEGRFYRYDTTGSGNYEIWLCVKDNGDDTYVWKQLNLV